MSYSLNAAAAYEGMRIAVNGSKGRLEAVYPFTGFQKSDGSSIKIFDLANNLTEYKIAELEGAHGGSDDLLLEDIFGKNAGRADPLNRAADMTAGVNSLMIGAAANISIKQGIIADIDELLR
jgi:hypothetical protein